VCTWYKLFRDGCATLSHSRSQASSRPPDPRWDVSGDKRVTSLDALMILQAVAGSIEIG
jgi:hypothetical protein